jgi:hypothetical protein
VSCIASFGDLDRIAKNIHKKLLTLLRIGLQKVLYQWLLGKYIETAELTKLIYGH